MNALVLKLNYLTGRSVATTYNNREQAEWPPHPARLYSALVATWADSEENDSAELAALEWLASLDSPSIYASEASTREVVPHFVPVNDVAVLDTFTRQRSKLDELKKALDEAKRQYVDVQGGGDKKAVDKAAKVLAKEEKALGSARKRLQKLLGDDQAPYVRGKHPGTGLKSARELVPEYRGKQPRSFPSVSPHDPSVFLRWGAPASELDHHRSALSVLASRVVRVGHSTSFVACSVVDDCPTPTWEPHEDGEKVLRVPGPDQFIQLREAFGRHKEIEPRVLPCRFQRYRKVGRVEEEASGRSYFGDDWIVFRQISGRRLSQTSCVELARAMRGALMKYADDPPPELLSGHMESGEPSETPHLAIIPLPFVGHPYASGELLGLALIFPRDADEGKRHAVLRAIGLWEEVRRKETDDELVDVPPLPLTLGRAGAIEVERVEWGVAPLKTLRSNSWCRPSRAWVTATPIALDRNPGDLFSRDPDKATKAYAAAEHSIATACERIGLPTPIYVQVHPSVPLHGAVKARAYPKFPADPKQNQRVKVHARIEFSVQVAGPIMLGAGRYYGLGLCRPQPHEESVEG